MVKTKIFPFFTVIKPRLDAVSRKITRKKSQTPIGFFHSLKYFIFNSIIHVFHFILSQKQYFFATGKMF